MSASVPVYVKVVVECEKWVEVSAVTLTEAKELVRQDGEIVRVISAQYEEPEDE